MEAKCALISFIITNSWNQFDLFQDLEYWGVDDLYLEACCVQRYYQQRELLNWDHQVCSYLILILKYIFLFYAMGYIKSNKIKWTRFLLPYKIGQERRTWSLSSRKNRSSSKSSVGSFWKTTHVYWRKGIICFDD